MGVGGGEDAVERGRWAGRGGSGGLRFVERRGGGRVEWWKGGIVRLWRAGVALGLEGGGCAFGGVEAAIAGVEAAVVY